MCIWCIHLYNGCTRVYRCKYGIRRCIKGVYTPSVFAHMGALGFDGYCEDVAACGLVRGDIGTVGGAHLRKKESTREYTLY